LRYKDEHFLRQKHFEEKLSTAQIAAEISSVRSTVAKYLKRFGIPMRPEDEAHALNKGQLAYGEKRRSNKTSDHQRELQILAHIQELRELGHSYHQVAAILTAMGIPTKNRLARWHAATVMKILKTHTKCEGYP
jgi:IS30 family transposase